LGGVDRSVRLRRGYGPVDFLEAAVRIPEVVGVRLGGIRVGSGVQHHARIMDETILREVVVDGIEVNSRPIIITSRSGQRMNVEVSAGWRTIGKILWE
jgi:hypothetical protein